MVSATNDFNSLLPHEKSRMKSVSSDNAMFPLTSYFEKQAIGLFDGMRPLSCTNYLGLQLQVKKFEKHFLATFLTVFFIVGQRSLADSKQRSHNNCS